MCPRLHLHGVLALGALVAAFGLSMPTAFAEWKLPPAAVKSAQRSPAPARASVEPEDPNAAAERRRALDQMQREDVAAQLALLGVMLKWQDHSLVELVDWRDRIEAAVTLRVQYRVNVDWRTTSLRDLIEMRLRAVKASELASVYGVHVDWRRYSWVAMEGLRRRVAKLPPGPDAVGSAGAVSGSGDDGLARPSSIGLVAPRRSGRRSQDPDAIIEPTFAFNKPVVWPRNFGRGGRSDPDAILIPTFVAVPHPPSGPDDVINPWAPRFRRSLSRSARP